MAIELPFRNFTKDENDTWRLIFHQQEAARRNMIHPMFEEGVHLLQFDQDRVPNIDEVNRRLLALTGFRGVPVEGLEDDASFYEMLGERLFPIGNFMRSRVDISYTPAPDVIHDLYGHLPFLAHRDYADFNAELGARAAIYRNRPEILKQFARLFWFIVEFGLIQTVEGKRIFGAGIASSIGECRFALSEEPEVLPFDLEVIRNRDFKIDEFQKTLFLVQDLGELYSCLPELERLALKSGGA